MPADGKETIRMALSPVAIVWRAPVAVAARLHRADPGPFHRPDIQIANREIIRGEDADDSSPDHDRPRTGVAEASIGVWGPGVRHLRISALTPSSGGRRRNSRHDGIFCCNPSLRRNVASHGPYYAGMDSPGECARLVSGKRSALSAVLNQRAAPE